jgi:hypothetical protein
MRIWFLIHPVEEQMEPPSPPQRIG